MPLMMVCVAVIVFDVKCVVNIQDAPYHAIRALCHGV